MSYHTTNIAVAAGLRSLGHKLEKIHVEGRLATFFFSQESGLVALEIESGDTLVDAIRFHQELRRLSGLARSMAESHG